MKRMLSAVLLCSLLLCGCGTGESPETVQGAIGTESPLRLEQENMVKREKYLDEQSFENFLSRSEKRFIIPGLGQAMVPQGMSFSEERGQVLISSYVSADVSSTITAVDYESGELEAEYWLYNADGSPFTSHVGGLAVTEDMLYVSAKLDNDGAYSIGAISLSELPEEGSHDIVVEKFAAMAVSPSFLSYSDGILWVGNFYHPKADYGLSPELNFVTETDEGDYGCYILGFDLRVSGRSFEDEEGYPLPDYILAAPDRIQGMSFDGERLVLSQSYGRKNNSALLCYGLNLEQADTKISLAGQDIPAWVLTSGYMTESITAMPMTEGLCLSPDGGVLVLFESGAIKYEDGKFRTDYVWELD